MTLNPNALSETQMKTFRHSRIEIGLDYLEEIIEEAAPGERMGRLYLLTGQSFVGKSTCVAEVRKSHPTILDGAGFVKSRPIMHVQLGAKPTHKGIMSDVVANLDLPPSSSDPGVLAEAVVTNGLEQGVRCLIIDEGQHFSERRTQTSIDHTVNFLKSVLNVRCFDVVLVGTPELIQLIRRADGTNPNRTGVQLENRMEDHVELRTFDPSDSTDVAEFAELLERIDERISPDVLNGLRHVAPEMIASSRGCFGSVLPLVRHAARHAKRDGRQNIVISDLSNAHTILRDGIRDPFAESKLERSKPSRRPKPLEQDPYTAWTRSKS